MVESSPPGRGEIQSIQALRAVAALSVLVGHTVLEAASNTSTQAVFNVGPLLNGVDLFFVISGFIMYHTSSAEFGRPGALGRFIWRRAIRVVPLYWLFTTLILLPLIASPAMLRSTTFDWWAAASSYLFIPYARESGRIAPLLSLGWTLNYEVFFYGLFGLALLLPRKQGVGALVGVLIALVLLGATIVRPEAPAPVRFWTDPIILEFVAGVGLGIVFRRVGKSRASAVAAVAVCLAAVGILSVGTATGLPRIAAAGLPATMIVFAALFLLPSKWERGVPQWVLLLGASSYALYLSHRFVLRLATLAAERFGISTEAYVAGTCMASILVAVTVFKLIEVPTQRVLREALPMRTHQIATRAR
jgi:peptidoglycan/LPS O-acetylase OafA/YrhL